jgi:hypothetical protein
MLIPNEKGLKNMIVLKGRSRYCTAQSIKPITPVRTATNRAACAQRQIAQKKRMLKIKSAGLD